MERLPAPALRALLAFLDEVSAAALDPFPERVLAGLEQLMPTDITGYNMVDLRRGRNVHAVRPFDAVPAELVPAFDRNVGQHPVLCHYLQTGVHRTLKLTDLLSLRQFRRLALWAEFYRPLGVELQLVATLPGPADKTIAFAVGRRRRDFTERERALLDLARPHLVAAQRTADALQLFREGLAA